MDQNIMKAQIFEYADEVLSPEQCESLTLIETDVEDFDIYLLETDTGSEYWVLANEWISLVKKSAIINTAQRAVASYMEKASQPTFEGKDRFHQE